MKWESAMRDAVRMKVSLLVVATLAGLLSVSGVGAQDISVSENGGNPGIEIWQPMSDQVGVTRERLMLDTDRSARAVAAEAAVRNGSIVEFGLALTDAELGELRLREGLMENLDVLEKFEQEQSAYAGAWLDHATGQIVVNFASDDPRIASEVKDELLSLGLVEDDSRLRVDLVDFSLDELLRDQESLMPLDLFPELVGTFVHVQSNALVLVVDESLRLPIEELPGTAAQLERDNDLDVRLMVTFGGSPVDEACVDRQECGGTSPRRAGVGIRLVGGGACSTAFNVITPGGDEFAVTAGHCWRGTNSGIIESADGSEFFGSLTNQNAYFQNCDCRLIQVIDTSTGNRLYQSDNLKFREITVRNTTVLEGALVRNYGQETDQNGGASGIVDTIYFTYTSSSGASFSGVVLASYASDFGDSGGAVGPYYRSRALGINAAKTPVGGVYYGAFFTMTRVENKLGVTTMTAPN